MESVGDGVAMIDKLPIIINVVFSIFHRRVQNFCAVSKSLRRRSVMMEKHKCFDCFREGKSYSGVYVPKWVCTLVQVRVSGTFVPVIGWNTAVVLINQWYKPRFTFLIIVPVFEGTRDLSEKSIVRRERRLTKDLLIINTLAPAPKHLNLFLGLEIVNRTNIIILFG